MLPHFVVFLALIGLQRIHFAQADAFDPTSHRAWHLVNDDKCGLQHPHQRVVGGEDAAIGEFPWVAMIKLRRLKGNSYYAVSVGSIISEQFVLTVAHAIPSEPINGGTVVAGEYNKRSNKDCNANNFCAPPTKNYDVESAIRHPDYVRGIEGRDIGLVKIKDKFQFSDFIAPICLEYGSLLSEDHADIDAVMTGWGVYKFSPQTNRKLIPAVLQKATFKIRDENTCKQDLSKVGVHTGDSNPFESFICAGGEDADHHIYLGDSGGSLVILETVDADIPRYFTVGLASLSATAQNPRMTPISDFYTRVSFYLKWILDTIAEKSGIKYSPVDQ